MHSRTKKLTPSPILTVKNQKNLNSSDDEEEILLKRKTTLCENYREYVTNTSIHGLKYSGDKRLSLFERLFFIFAFIIVILMSAYFISNVWDKWSDTPVIIGLNPVSTPLKNIPFPAVTICNMNQAKKSVARHIQENTLDQSLLQSVCAHGDIFNTTENYQGKWSYFRNFLLNVSQPCSEMLLKCRFGMENQLCSTIFNSVLTDEGICCTFNAVDSKHMFQNFRDSDMLDRPGETDPFIGINWTPETGYPNVMTKEMYPRPVPGSGSHLGLTVILDARVDDYQCSSTNCAGFKILLHNPTETPKIADFGFSVAPSFETRVVVTPKISDASELIRKVSVNLRQCIFANEGNLTYFQTYSKKNCEMECESRLTEQNCGCVQYFMPRTTDETNICSRKDAVCYEKIKMAVDLSNNESFSCSCLPGCFEIGYGLELSTAQIGTGSFEIRDSFLTHKNPEYVRQNIALIHIFFIESSFRSYTKGELIGFTEFLSNTGGLLGLFMGFSVLSLVEIFYFLTFRPYCARKRYKNKIKSNDNILNENDKTMIKDNNKLEYLEKQFNSKLDQPGNVKIWQNRNYTTGIGIKNSKGDLIGPLANTGIDEKFNIKKFVTKRVQGIQEKIGNVGAMITNRKDDPPQYPYFE